MKKLFNKFISIGISLLFFCAIFHLDHHPVHEQPSGYNICNIGCEDIEHHFHPCEKCLNKTSRYVVKNLFNLSLYNNSTSFENPEEIIFLGYLRDIFHNCFLIKVLLNLLTHQNLSNLVDMQFLQDMKL